MQKADWIKCVKNQGHRTCRPSKGTPSVCGIPLGALHKDSFTFPPVRSTSSVFAASSFWDVEGVRKLSSLKPETSSTVILRYSLYLIRSNRFTKYIRGQGLRLILIVNIGVVRLNVAGGPRLLLKNICGNCPHHMPCHEALQNHFKV